MELPSTIGSRIDDSPVVAGLVVGDVVAITAFVLIGQVSHGFSPLADSGRVAGALAPFLVAWILVSFSGGLYRRTAVETIRQVALFTIPAWVVTVVIAQLLRSTSVFPGNASVTFALVAAGFGGLMLVGWRLVAALAVNE